MTVKQAGLTVGAGTLDSATLRDDLPQDLLLLGRPFYLELRHYLSTWMRTKSTCALVGGPEEHLQDDYMEASR